MLHPNKEIMRELIAYTAKKKGSQRTGCFIVKGNTILSRSISTVEETKDPTTHGEMNALRKLCRLQRNYHIKECWVYTTQIPCPMCASALVWAEAKGIIYGWDGRHTWGKLHLDPKIILKTAKRKIQIFGPFLQEECLKIKGYRMR